MIYPGSNIIWKKEDYLTDFIQLMNKYGSEKEPFMFIIDFDMKCPEIHKLDSVPSGIKFQTPLFSNTVQDHGDHEPVSLPDILFPYPTYSEAFRKVHKQITLGNSYLLNLTFPTVIETDLTLEEIFFSSVAKYKLLYYDKFVVFSPEIFIRISEGAIRSFPMKGTIEASVADAEKLDSERQERDG